MAEQAAAKAQPRTRFRNLLTNAGPGVISGAANDDPSCIVTYSIAGAAFGYVTLWTSVYSLPLIAAVQLMCARLGLSTGRGLAGSVRVNYSKWVLWPLCAMLAAANIVTLGADLGGMASVTQMVTGVPAAIWTAVYAAFVAGLLFFLSYAQIQKTFKWLCLALFSYVLAGILAKPDAQRVLSTSFIPQVDWSSEYVAMLVALLGATMSPYFLFWQTSQEVEEYCIGRRTVAEKEPGLTCDPPEHLQLDIFVGSFISKLTTYFITLTTAATLFTSGQKNIATAEDAARALRPVAGEGAFWLFAIGVVGTGLLAVPVLAASCAYAWSEAMRWRGSLSEKPRFDPKFYTVLFLSVGAGLVFIYMGFNVVSMLYWASILNGLLAPVCILLVLLLTGNQSVMGEFTMRGWVRTFGWMAFAVTALAAIAMLGLSLTGW